MAQRKGGQNRRKEGSGSPGAEPLPPLPGSSHLPQTHWCCRGLRETHSRRTQHSGQWKARASCSCSEPVLATPAAMAGPGAADGLVCSCSPRARENNVACARPLHQEGPLCADRRAVWFGHCTAVPVLGCSFHEESYPSLASQPSLRAKQGAQGLAITTAPGVFGAERYGGAAP